MLSLLLALFLQAPPPQSATFDFGAAKVKVTVELLPATTPPPIPTKRPLVQGDFKYLGRQQVKLDGAGDLHWGQGFALRKVNGELRVLSLAFKGHIQGATRYRLCEFKLVGEAWELTRKWEEPWGTAEHRGLNTGEPYHGLWWDEAGQRLWTTSCTDYAFHEPTEPSICTHRLSDDGTVTVKGPWTLKDRGATRNYGGFSKLPDGRYLTGWGGYTSLLDQGASASLAPTCYALTDPEQMATGSIAHTVLIDYGKTDRGIRNSDIIDYYDGRDPRQNPQTPPTEPPNPPPPVYPDGFTRWAWGDACRGGAWVETADAHGLVLLPSFGSGKCYYMGSTLNCDRYTFEMQVFSIESLTGGAVRPASRWLIDLPGRGKGGSYGPWGTIAGAAFDPESRKIYAYSPGAPNGYDCWVYVWQVGL